MVRHGARGLPASFLLLCLGLGAVPVRAAALPTHTTPATVSGACDLLLAAGVSPGGPTLGVRARFRNGFEIGVRQAQWGDAVFRDAGLYYLLGSGGRGGPYLGTELFLPDAASPSLGGKASKPALLFLAGREVRIGGPFALSAEAAAGPRLTRATGGPLPPLAFQARMQMVVRVF